MGGFLGQPALILADPDMARELLAKEGEAITVGWPPSTRGCCGGRARVWGGKVGCTGRLPTPRARLQAEAGGPRLHDAREPCPAVRRGGEATGSGSGHRG